MVLIIDDEESLQELLLHALERDGYRVLVAGTCAAGLSAFRTEAPDAVLLDVMLPDGSGHDVCRAIRTDSTVPIIMLTALDDEVDKVIGLELGADDYIAKPFSPRELQARIKALLRRAEFRQPEKEKEPSRRLRFAEWTLDTLSHQLTHDDGSLLDLSGSDAMLLGMFLQQPGLVLDRDTISDATRGRESLPMERGIDVQISRLRQKLGDNGKSPRIIKTIRGSGYMLIAEVHELP